MALAFYDTCLSSAIISSTIDLKAFYLPSFIRDFFNSLAGTFDLSILELFWFFFAVFFM